MKRLVSYVLVFVLGFGACAFILKEWWGTPGGGGYVPAITSSPEGARYSPAVVSKKGGNAIADVAASIGPAVVNIDTTGKPISAFPGLDLPNFFGLPTPEEAIPKGQASGVIIRPEGYVLTNNHVVANAQTIMVSVNLDGKTDRERATVVGTDPQTDLAVLKIPPRRGGYPYVKFGDSSNLRVGDWVVAIGNSLGLGTTVTVGVVSAKGREVPVEGETLRNAIQTDAAINRGNSGGALLDLNGRLIGINSAIASTSPGGGSIGIGFAIPSNAAQAVANELISKGRVVRPWIGISYQPLTSDWRQALEQQGSRNVPREGMLVRQVMSGSPADKADIQVYDVVTKVNGRPVTDKNGIAKAIEGKKPGDLITLEVWRAQTGQISRVAVRLGEMPQELLQR